MSSVTKRGAKWYVMWRGADGRLAQKVTPALTKAEAVRFAQDKERQAWRQREGLEPLPDEALPFGELMDWWWKRYGAARRGYANEQFKAFLEKHLGELRPVEVRPATAGQFADRLDKLLVAREQVLSAQTLNHLRAAVFGMFEDRKTGPSRRCVRKHRLPVRTCSRSNDRRSTTCIRRHDGTSRSLAYSWTTSPRRTTCRSG